MYYQQILSSNLNGTGIQVVLQFVRLSKPYWVASVGNYMYFSDNLYPYSGIYRYNKAKGATDVLGKSLVFGLNQIIYFERHSAMGKQCYNNCDTFLCV